MNLLPFFTSLVVIGMTGCSVVSHYAGSYGNKAEKGEVIEGGSFTYRVPVSLLRVHVDDDGLVAYEDFGPGMGRGRVFVVRVGPSHKKRELLDDLRQFGRSPARALRDGRLVSTHSGMWKSFAVEFHLIEVPEISRSFLGEKSKIVDRERLWVLGVIVPMAGRRYWVSLTSNDQFFREEEGISGWNLDRFYEFANGLQLEAN